MFFHCFIFPTLTKEAKNCIGHIIVEFNPKRETHDGKTAMPDLDEGDGSANAEFATYSGVPTKCELSFCTTNKECTVQKPLSVDVN